MFGCRHAAFAVIIVIPCLCNAQEVSLYDIYIQGINDDAAEFVVDKSDPTKTIRNPARDTQPRLDFEGKLDKLITGTLGAGGSLKGFYFVKSNIASASHTEVRVSGSRPQCGAADKQLGDDTLVYITMISTLGAAIDAAGAGGAASFVLGAVSAVVGHTNRYQTTATCADACALIPASLNGTDLTYQTNISYDGGTSWQNRQPNANSWDPWSHIEPPVMAVSTAKIRVNGSGPLSIGHEARTCEMKLVCSRLRNWSHNRDLKMQMTVTFDATNATQSSCTDSSMMTSFYQDSFARRAMDEDRLYRYSTSYLSESMSLSRPIKP